MKLGKIIYKLAIFICITGTIWILTGCKKEQNEQEHTHSKVHVLRKEPTCIAEGNIEYWYCSQCGKIFQDRAENQEIGKDKITLPKINHQIVEDSQTPATCESEGVTTGKHCSICNEVFEEPKTIPALGHQYDFKKIKWEWEDFHAAKLIVFCENDAAHQLNYTAKIKEEIIKPTCTEPGKKIYTATVEENNEIYQDVQEETILPIGHDFDLSLGIWVWEDEQAYMNVSCLHDSSHILRYDAVVTKEVQPATCIDSGKITYNAKAEIDGQAYTDQKEVEISVLGHHYDPTSIQWSWTNTDSAVASIPCLNDETHPYVAEGTIQEKTTPATCTQTGNITYTATIEFENKSYTDQKIIEIATTEHDINYEDYEWVWNEYESATLVFKCKNDASHEIPFEGSIVENTTQATCFEEGKKEYTATVTIQGQVYESKKESIIPIDPNAHDYAYDHPIFHWKDEFDQYHVEVEVKCKCGKDFLNYNDVSLTQETESNSFEKEGFIKYNAQVDIEGLTYQDEKTLILPRKTPIHTATALYENIQQDSFELVLYDDIVLTQDCIVGGSLAILDLNGHCILVESYPLQIQSQRCIIKNGDIVSTSEKIDSLQIKNTQNVIIEKINILGKISTSSAKLCVRDSILTSLFSTNITAETGSEILIWKTQVYQNHALPIFYIDGKEVTPGSKIILDSDVHLFSTGAAKLYDEKGLSPILLKPVAIETISIEEYLLQNVDYKCLSLNQNAELKQDVSIVGKKLVLDFAGYQLNLAGFTFKIQVENAVIENGTIEGNSSSVFLDQTNVLFDCMILNVKLDGNQSTVQLKDTHMQF